MAKKGNEKNLGYIKLHRTLLQSAIWQGDAFGLNVGGKEFDIRSAWIDLLLSANYTDKPAMSSTGDELMVHRGQLLTSQKNLAKRWNWSASKVHNVLVKLKNAKMLDFETLKWGRGCTLITIQNYCKYQGSSDFDKSNVWQTCGKTKSNVCQTTAHLKKGKKVKKGKKEKEGGEPEWD